MEIEILGEIRQIEIIAASRAIREETRLRRMYGSGRWRKLRGIALVRLPDDSIATAEVHWYEAHGIGKKEIKVKHILEE